LCMPQCGRETLFPIASKSGALFWQGNIERPLIHCK
jgi:hypothetical protein